MCRFDVEPDEVNPSDDPEDVNKDGSGPWNGCSNWSKIDGNLRRSREISSSELCSVSYEYGSGSIYWTGTSSNSSTTVFLTVSLL